MNFVKLVYHNDFYKYVDASTMEMNNLGNFLKSDVRCYWPGFMEWALHDRGESISSNTTFLRKENGKVFLSDLYSEDDEPVELEMTLGQFIQILNAWQEKVCKMMPKEVIIKHENGEFVIETKN
jgi:hypothetical protein